MHLHDRRLAMTIIIFLLITVQGKPRFSVARPYLRILAPQQFEFLRLYNKFALNIAKRKAAPFKSRKN